MTSEIALLIIALLLASCSCSGQDGRDLIRRKQRTYRDLVLGSSSSGPGAIPTVRIRLGSLEEVLAVLEQLGDRYPVEVDWSTSPSGGRRPRKVSSPSGARASSCPPQPAPRWTTRPNVCRHETDTFHGFTPKFLHLMRRNQTCRRFVKSYVCVDRFGSGEFSPSKITTTRCCDGFRLTRSRAVCRRTTKRNNSIGRAMTSPKHRLGRLAAQQGGRRRIKFLPRVGVDPSQLRRLEDDSPAKTRRRFPGFLPQLATLNYTTFVPNDSILENDFGDDPSLVDDILDNLVIADKLLLSRDIANNDIHAAISGNPIRFNFYGARRQVMTVNCELVSSRDFAPDGDLLVYHVIEGLLTHVTGTAAGYLRQLPQIFSTFTAALERVGMMRELDDESRLFTVLAPTNQALGWLDVGSDSEACLRELVHAHVIDDEMFCSVAPAMELRTRSNLTVQTSRDEALETSYVNGTEIIKSDAVCLNGVVHFLPAPLHQARDLEQLLRSRPESFSTFHDLILEQSMGDAVAKMRDAILVVPSNRAFEEMKAEARAELRNNYAQLRARLPYHVIPSAGRDDVIAPSSGERVTRHATEGGGVGHVTRYPLRRSGGGGRRATTETAYQCARVSEQQPPDVTTCAGSVVQLDQIPPPSSRSIMSVLEESPRLFSTLVRLVREAGLEETLRIPTTDSTLFAPTNDVFARFKPSVMNRFFGSPSTARNTILFHLVQGFKCRAELTQKPLTHVTMIGESLTTCPKRAGKVLLVGRDRARMRSRVTRSDLLADNGIVHAISNLLLSSSSAPRRSDPK